MAKSAVSCGVCGYSAPRRSGGIVGKHYGYILDDKYLCFGSGKTEQETHEPPLVASRLREKVRRTP